MNGFEGSTGGRSVTKKAKKNTVQFVLWDTRIFKNHYSRRQYDISEYSHSPVFRMKMRKEDTHISI